MAEKKQKLVKVPDVGIVAFPSDMEDEHVAAAIRAFKQQTPDQNKHTHATSPHATGKVTEESEHQRLIGGVPEVIPNWNTVRQAVYKATEPTLPNPDTKPADSSWGANRDAAWNAGANTLNVGGNVLKRAARFTFGVADMPTQVYGIMSRLFSSDEKTSQQAEGELLDLHPGAQIADRMKEAVHDWRKSKSLAAENALGDILGVFLLEKAGKSLPKERIRQLEAEGVVLPPEAKPKVPEQMGAPHTTPTIEGEFRPVGTSKPVAVEPVEAAANLKRTTPPTLPQVRAEANRLAPGEPHPTKFKYGNTRADIPPDSEAATALTVARKGIAPQDLAGKGIEQEPHITVRYGIDGEDTAGIRAYLEKQAPFTAMLGKTTAFPPSPNSDGAAPIVVGIDAPELHRMEGELDHHGNFIDRTFPEYKPHATLAYVKPEAAPKYVGMAGTEGKKFTVNSVTISKKDGTTEEVPLKGKPPTLTALKQQAEALKPTPIEAQMNLKYTGAGGAQPFYLKSEKILADKMRGPMPAADVQKMLAANGVKDEEMKWTGLDDFLKEKRNEKVTPQEIQEHLAGNNLQIKEVVKGQPKPTQWTEHHNGVLTTPEGYKIERLESNGKYVATSNSGVRQAFDTIDEAKSKVDYWRKNSSEDEVTPKFSSYQLPGGQNYRELLLTMPPKESIERPFEVKYDPDARANESWVIIKNGMRQGYASNSTDANAMADHMFGEGWRQRNPVQPENFRSGHWDEPNVLGHVRFNDRTGPNGEKILHVEELQSDWHQKGRSTGYSGEQPKHTTLPEGYVLHEMGSFRNPGGKQYWVVGPDGKQFTAAGFNKESAMNEAINRLNDEDRASRGKHGSPVPDAPFKKNWHELMLKRMMKYAAEHGYDGVSWTPGEQQAERYDLSKQVSELRYKKEDDGTYRLNIYTPEGGKEDLGSFTEAKLADTVGKDVAQKIVNGEGDDSPGGRKRLVGNDLKVGGEGMKGFYDKIVPDAMNKIAKKFGTKVAEIPIHTKPNEDNDVIITGTDEDGFGVFDRSDPMGPPLEEFDTAEEAEDYVAKLGAKKIVPYLPITPEMRAGVKAEPFALFKLIYKPPAASQAEVEREWSNIGDVQRELDKIPPMRNTKPGDIQKWRAEYDAWLAKAQPWIDKYREAATRIENLQNKSVGQLRQLPDGKTVLYLKQPALNSLYQAMTGSESARYTLSGASFEQRAVYKLIGNLNILKPAMHHELTEMMLRGTGKDGLTVSMIPRKGESLREALSTLREELNHGWQKAFASATGNHLPEAKFKELNDAIPNAMMGYLRMNYPEITYEDTASQNRLRVLESSAKMLSDAPVKFGLTEDQAAAYLFQYFHAVEESHGAKALDELLHITKLAKEIKNDYFNATARVGGRSADQGSVRGVQEERLQRTEGTSPPEERGAPEGTGAAPSLEDVKKEAAKRRAMVVQ